MSVSIPRETEISTERLILRAPRRQDFTAWSEGRAADRQHLEPWEPRWPSDALSRDDWMRRLKAWRATWQDDRAYVFLIFKLGTGELIGGISITHVRRGPSQAASIGYWLFQAHQGQGFMQEALKAVCRWSRDVLGLFRLEAGTLPENRRSRAVLNQSGFVEEGRAASYLEINGRRRDHILFGINLADLPV